MSWCCRWFCWWSCSSSEGPNPCSRLIIHANSISSRLFSIFSNNSITFWILDVQRNFLKKFFEKIETTFGRYYGEKKTRDNKTVAFQLISSMCRPTATLKQRGKRTIWKSAARRMMKWPLTPHFRKRRPPVSATDSERWVVMTAESESCSDLFRASTFSLWSISCRGFLPNWLQN